MKKIKPFDVDNLDISKSLGPNDFNLSLNEINFVSSVYKYYINLKIKNFNGEILLKDFPCAGGVRFNYLEYNLEDEVYIRSIINNTISKVGYFIPLTFEQDMFDYFDEFDSSFIAKVELNVKNYWRVMDSLISIYTGEFMLIPEKKDFLMFVRNGDFIISLHREMTAIMNIEFDEGIDDYYDKTLFSLLSIYKNVNLK